MNDKASKIIEWHRGEREMTTLALLFLPIAIAGSLFQVGHFVEHATQFGMWVFVDHTRPYMSPIANWLCSLLDRTAICSDAKQQAVVSVEMLHLIGNSIFLMTIAAWSVIAPDNRWVRWALYVEAFHLCEHLMLTTSAIWLGHPIGMSTLFGYASDVLPHDLAVGYRVSWHFFLNLIPSALLMMAMMEGHHGVRARVVA
jgi:hypothetical protein